MKSIISTIFIFILFSNHIYAQIVENYDSIEVNVIKTRIYSSGMMFWDGEGLSKFEVPKGSGKTAVFANNLWIAGKDNLDTLHIAAERFRSDGSDFRFGPVMDTNYYTSQISKWNKVWKLSKVDIDFHKSHWGNTSYSIPSSILLWPGNGETLKGQNYLLAPYFDANVNGLYDPQNGDYPIIRGDQALFIIYNDMFEHLETKGNRLNIEIHAMVYGYNAQNDSSLYNSLFINYRIFNRSNINFDSVFLGLFSDLDIGYAYDDYIGCDTLHNMFFAYNGIDNDGLGNSDHYGANPPAVGVVLLNNPMTSFIAISNNKTLIGDPEFPIDYYNNMQAKWRDGTHLLYGGKGYLSGGSTNIPCNYLYSGNWTEASVGNTPFDRRGLASSGPFTLPKDSSLCYDIAYIYARDTSIATSINLLKQRTSQLQTFYNANLAHNCNDFFTGINEVPIEKVDKIQIYPNPTNSKFTIQRSNSEKIEIEIVDFTGKLLLKKQSENNLEEIDLSKFTSGLYLIRISTKQAQIVKKIIKE